MANLSPEDSQYGSALAALDGIRQLMGPGTPRPGYRHTLMHLQDRPVHQITTALAWCHDAANRAALGEPAAWGEATEAARACVHAYRQMAGSQASREDAAGISELSYGLPALAAFVSARADRLDEALELLDLARAVSLRKGAALATEKASAPVGSLHHLLVTNLGGAIISRYADGRLAVSWLDDVTHDACWQRVRVLLGHPRRQSAFAAEYAERFRESLQWAGEHIGQHLLPLAEAGQLTLLPVGAAQGLPLECSLLDGGWLCAQLAITVAPAVLREPDALGGKGLVSLIDDSIHRAGRKPKRSPLFVGADT